MTTETVLGVPVLAVSFRGEHPGHDVVVGHTHDGRVMVGMSPEAAFTLARVIARFETLARDHAVTHPDEPAMEYDAAAWTSTIIDLVASQAMCGPLPDPVYAIAPESGYLRSCKECGTTGIYREGTAERCTTCGVTLPGAPA